MDSPICLILAGGFGTRLSGLLPDLPKCLAPVAGRPFLELQIASLRERGLGRIALALGFRADQVLAAVNDMQLPDPPRLVVEREPLGTGGAIANAMSELGVNEIVVANGDTYVAGTLDELLRPLDVASGEMARIAVVEVPDRHRFGGVVFDSRGCVVDFLEKGQSGPGPINAGLYRLNRSVLQVATGSAFSLETAVLPNLANHGALWAAAVAGPFVDIGVPEDYLRFCRQQSPADSRQVDLTPRTTGLSATKEAS